MNLWNIDPHFLSQSLYPSRTLPARISFRDVVNNYVKTENIVSLNLVKKEGEYFEEDSKDSLQALVKKEGEYFEEDSKDSLQALVKKEGDSSGI